MDGRIKSKFEIFSQLSRNNVSFPRKWESIRMDPRLHGDDKDSLDSEKHT